MAGGSSVQPIERVGCTCHGAIEPERKRGRTQVVVNRLWHAYDRNSILVKLLGNRQRTVAADANQPGEIELFASYFHTGEQSWIEFNAVVHARHGDESSFVGRAENCSTLG